MAIGAIGTSALSSINQTTVTAMRPKTAADMLEAMDTDKNGSVSKDEFVAFGEKMKAQGPKGPAPAGAKALTLPSADQLFASADDNGDNSLSVDELSAMMAQAETQRASAGGMSGPGKGPPPAGAGGPPPGGGMKGASGATGTDDSSSASSATSDPADTNHDGTVSAAERLLFSLTHPAAGS
jgi:hypothetical protein